MMVASQPRVRTMHTRRVGMGVTSGQLVSGGAALATSGVAVASAAGTLAPLAATLGVTVPVLGAIIGAGIMAAAEAITLIMNSGCGQTCIVSTQFANQANAALQQAIAAYFALPTPRRRSAQLAYLALFDNFWAWLQAPGQCGNPALGAAGQRCITDRQAGACTWHQSATTVPPWATPPAGACWNWWNGYRDPVANDPNVYDDTATIAGASTNVSSALQSVQSSVSSLPGGWLLPALALLALVVIL